MSCLKEDHALPKKSIALFERILAEKIMRELRLEYNDTRCAVKHISKRTGISFNTIKRWYNGHNMPVSQHLLVLTRHYNCALRAFLEASGTPAEAKALHRQMSAAIEHIETNPVAFKDNEDIFSDVKTTKKALGKISMALKKRRKAGGAR